MSDEISDEERSRRVDAAIAEAIQLRQSGAPRHVYWMSFANDDGFLGAALVDDAVSPADAIASSYAHGCNPGHCEVSFVILPPEAFVEDVALRNAPRNVLMNKAELLARRIIREHTD